MSLTFRAIGCVLAVLAACGGGGGAGSPCGPSKAKVVRAVDGDTLVIEGEIKVRYIGVDTPESTTSVECYGPEAAEYNKSVVEGKVVTLEYDEACTDKYGRLLAYVFVDGGLVARTLIDKGYGCALIMAPNDAKKEELLEAEMVAQVHGEGLWSACDPNPCK